MPLAALSIGDISYRVAGPDRASGSAVVFVHGVLVDGTLWDQVADQLAARGIRSYVPDWPLGSHREPMPTDADLSPGAIAGAIGEFVDRVVADDGIESVILVGNDTGGGLVQLALAEPNERIAGVVFTNCDAFERFPPLAFKPIFAACRHPWVAKLLLAPAALTPMRHSFVGFGMLLRRPRPAALTAGWLRPARTDKRIRRDLARFTRALRGDMLVDAADWLGRFTKPVRVVWGMRDRNFTPALGRRLAEAFPHAEFIEVPDATTFVPVDQPAAVVAAVAELVALAAPSSTSR